MRRMPGDSFPGHFACPQLSNNRYRDNYTDFSPQSDYSPWINPEALHRDLVNRGEKPHKDKHRASKRNAKTFLNIFFLLPTDQRLLTGLVDKNTGLFSHKTLSHGIKTVSFAYYLTSFNLETKHISRRNLYEEQREVCQLP